MTTRDARGDDASRPVTLFASDGVALVGRLYVPPAPADLTVLMLPGIGVRQRAFRHLATWLAGEGVRCLTLDYRGIGESALSAQASHSASLRAWSQRDAVAALRYAEQTWPEAVAVIGHSFGGQLLGLAGAFQRLSAAVLLAASFGQPRHWDWPDRWLLHAYWHAVLPLASTLYARVPAWAAFGETLPRGVGREWSRWGRQPDWFLSSEPDARANFAGFRAPVLGFAVSDDFLAPGRAVQALLDCFTAAEVMRRDVSPRHLGVPRIGHLGLLRPGATQPVWRAVLDFLRRHAGRR